MPHLARPARPVPGSSRTGRRLALTTGLALVLTACSAPAEDGLTAVSSPAASATSAPTTAASSPAAASSGPGSSDAPAAPDPAPATPSSSAAAAPTPEEPPFEVEVMRGDESVRLASEDLPPWLRDQLSAMIRDGNLESAAVQLSSHSSLSVPEAFELLRRMKERREGGG